MIDIEKNEINMIIGSYLKVNRIEENMSLNFLSDIVKINKGFLSEIERGRRKPADYALKQILKGIGIPLFSEYEYLKIGREFANKVILHFEEMDYNTEKIILEDFLNRKEYGYSIGFMQYYLLEFTYQIQFKKDPVKMEELYSKLILFNIELYSMKERLLFYDIIALYYMDMKRDYVSAQTYLNKALQDETKNTLTSSLIGVILYHLIDINQRLNSSVKALMLCNDAESIFIESFNVKRLAYLNMHKANCFSRLGMYDEAERLYLKLLKQADILGVNAKCMFFDNLAWNELKRCDYEKVIHYAKKSIEFGSRFNAIYEYIPYAYLKLNQFELCLKWMEYFDQNNDLEERQKLFFKSLKSWIYKDETFIINFNKYIDIINTIGDQEMTDFTLKIKFDYYYENQMFKEASKCAYGLLEHKNNYSDIK